MAYYGVQATMTGTAIALSTLLPKVPFAKYIRVQGATANAAATSVGNSALTTTTNIGAQTGPVASVNEAIVLGPTDNQSLKLDQVFVVGANTEIVYISVIA